MATSLTCDRLCLPLSLSVSQSLAMLLATFLAHDPGDNFLMFCEPWSERWDNLSPQELFRSIPIRSWFQSLDFIFGWRQARRSRQYVKPLRPEIRTQTDAIKVHEFTFSTCTFYCFFRGFGSMCHLNVDWEAPVLFAL